MIRYGDIRWSQVASNKLSPTGVCNVREKKHFPQYAAALEAPEFVLRMVGTLKYGNEKHITFSWQRLGGVIQMEAETIVAKPFSKRSTPARGGEGAKWLIGGEQRAARCTCFQLHGLERNIEFLAQCGRSVIMLEEQI